MSVNTKIARASLVLIAVSFAGHILSLGKEMLVASRFGLLKEMDAFYAAVTVPNLLTNILVSTFVAAFIPVFVRYRSQEHADLHRIASVVINHVAVLLAAVSASLFLFAPAIVRYGFHGLDPATAALAVDLLRMLSVTVLLSGIVGVLSAVLNAYEVFGMPAVFQAAVTVTTIAFVSLFSGRMGVYTLAYGLLSGIIIQCAALLMINRRQGVRYSFTLDRTHGAVREIAASATVLFLGVVASQINMLIDRVMASYLPAGSLAALGYADKLVQVPLIILSGSLSTAIFPYFSRQAAENRIDEMRDSIAKGIRMTAFVFIPLTVMLSLLAKPAIRLLFERGAFTPSATELTSVVFAFYSLQFFFYTVVIIFGRAFLAMRAHMTYLKITVTGILLNILMNFVLMRLIRPPVAGIALSTSVVLAVSCCLYAVAMAKKKIRLDWRYIFSGTGKVAAASAAAGWSLSAVFSWYNGFWPSHSAAVDLAGIALAAGAAGSVFFALSRMLRLEEVQRALSVFRRQAGADA